MAETAKGKTAQPNRARAMGEDEWCWCGNPRFRSGTCTDGHPRGSSPKVRIHYREEPSSAWGEAR